MKTLKGEVDATAPLTGAANQLAHLSEAGVSFLVVLLHPLSSTTPLASNMTMDEKREVLIRLMAELGARWHPFDPDDEGTWPRSGAYYIFCDDEHAPQAVMGFRAEMVDLWRSLKVTHYTELLPGPRAEKTNG